ncbi:hypothetical protein JHK85_026856 [Glycine max]|nr:hypothetical protein JHK85_026856 [Glycine max]KAG5014104.1 hypothetical protein JHK86_026365 [Glycine max]
MSMDMACSLPQSRVLHGGLGTSYRHRSVGQLGCFDFRGRGFGCASFGDSRSVSRLQRSRMNVSACWNNSRVATGREFKVLNTKRSLSCKKNNNLFMVSRVIWSKCQGNDSLAYVNGNGRNVDYGEGSGEDVGLGPVSSAELDATLEEEEGQAERKEGGSEIGLEELSVDELKELLQKALKELEVAQINSTMFEEKVKKISETAISLHDEAVNSWNNVNSTLGTIQEIANEEHTAKEVVQNATMALSLAEARLQVAIESLEAAKEVPDSAQGSNESSGDKDTVDEEQALLVAKEDIKECQANLANCEAELRHLQDRKEELQKEVSKLQEIAEKAQLNAVKAEEDVTNIMLLAEQAVAFELEATKLVNDAEIALQRADKSNSNSNADTIESTQAQDVVVAVPEEEKVVQGFSGDVERDRDLAIDDESVLANLSPETLSDKTSQVLEDKTQSDYLSDNENAVQTKKQEIQKDLTRDSSLAPKALLKKSSRFFSASFFSSAEDGTEFTPASVFQSFVLSVQKQLPKLIFGLLLMGAGVAFYSNRVERNAQLLTQADVIMTSVEEVSSNAKPLFRQLQKLPKKIKKIIASLPHQELSVERLSSMKKYVFGLGSAQVLATAVAVGLMAHYICGQAGPAAIVIGNGLALSSTAVVLQVLQERGESTSRHGRATFSVLLFQVGFQAIAEALGLAAVKAAVAITAIIAGGRLLLRPIYKQVAENQNAEIFSANTLLVILGTSLLTARAGLSMALGAFLAGLLLAETEFSLQVESDIAPYRGLLLGLFFMTVGMSIDPKLLVSNFPVITGTLGLLICGKTILVCLIGRMFGISLISAIRVGLLLAPGGEFAFVAFGEAVNQGIMSSQLSSLLFLVVGISMAITPWLAAGGQLIASRFEQNDVRSLLPVESETDDLQDHIIICGFGRVGQIIAQLLSERLIPFVALDVRSDRVAVGRALDLPVYFGDAGSREVLHKVGAERACAAAITLDTPGANYRTVWALSKYFPNVKTFVRAHDVDHGLNLEKAGATAVVPETLEPSLQLAAAVLSQAKLPTSEIAATINEFRSRHLAELTELCEASGSSLGYGFNRIMNKPKSPSPDSLDETPVSEGTLAI